MEPRTSQLSQTGWVYCILFFQEVWCISLFKSCQSQPYASSTNKTKSSFKKWLSDGFRACKPLVLLQCLKSTCPSHWSLSPWWEWIFLFWRHLCCHYVCVCCPSVDVTRNVAIIACFNHCTPQLIKAVLFAIFFKGLSEGFSKVNLRWLEHVR